MNTNDDAAATKMAWTTPALVELDLTMDDVENGLRTGNDGGGGRNSSLS